MVSLSTRMVLALCLLALLNSLSLADFSSSLGTRRLRLVRGVSSEQDSYNRYVDNQDNGDDNDDVDDENSGDVESELEPLTEKTDLSASRSWASGFIKVIQVLGKYGGKLNKFTTPIGTGAAVSTSVANLMHGCCKGSTDTECQYHFWFESNRTRVLEMVDEADRKELEGQKLQVYVEAVFYRYNEILAEINDINDAMDGFLDALAPNLNKTLTAATATIKGAIQSDSEGETSYLQVAKQYEKIIQETVTKSFPVMELMISGGEDLYKFAKKRKALALTSNVEKLSAIKLNPGWTGTSERAKYEFGYAQVPRLALRGRMVNFQSQLNPDLVKGQAFAKGAGAAGGAALGLFGTGMKVYGVINSHMECQERKEKAREAMLEMSKCKKKFEEILRNITAAKEVVQKAFETVYSYVTSDKFAIVMDQTKKILEKLSSPKMVDVAGNIATFKDQITGARDDERKVEILQKELLRNLMRVPLTIHCYTNEVRSIATVLEGCRKGRASFDRLFDQAKNLEDPDGECSAEIGENYMEKSSMKLTIGKQMAREGKQKMCQINNEDYVKAVCTMSKDDGDTTAKIAQDLNMSEDVVTAIIANCKPTEREIRKICFYKKRKWTDDKIAKKFGYEAATISKVEC
ncbi:uncharacterized protein LOC5518721 isoform X1 [Nematostella vectensis]|uniref:uncharacterized protein LOC5518721 isoform X1 n=1 Tax=Nematostella vectensis TaxID=45351 RepID=UPI0020774354|nr:uncharacterized protein LOC5518721 isoform X1 [Nematostella vectensis]